MNIYNTSRKVSTQEFAAIILAKHKIIHTFTTTKDTEGLEVQWYGVVCVKIFGVYSLLINQWSIIGGTPFMFDLPSFDESIDSGIEDPSEECLQETIEGLNRFSEKYGLPRGTWYVTDEWLKLK